MFASHKPTACFVIIKTKTEVAVRNILISWAKRFEDKNCGKKIMQEIVDFLDNGLPDQLKRKIKHRVDQSNESNTLINCVCNNCIFTLIDYWYLILKYILKRSDPLRNMNANV